MAVVVANHVRQGRGERATAKANICYIQERPGRTNERLTRTLFGASGILGKREAYQFINEAPKGTLFYRLKLSPDPKREDTKRDLSMQQLTLQMMQRLEKRLNTPIPWAAALHDDHSDIRHVHVLAALPRRLQKRELVFLIRETTNLCREQRRALDRPLRRFAFTRQASSSPRLRTPMTPHSQTPLPRKHTYPKALRPWIMPPGASHARGHAFCTCPRCHFPQTHNRLSGIHSCVSCGLMLHKKRALSLTKRKGRGWDRSL